MRHRLVTCIVAAVALAAVTVSPALAGDRHRQSRPLDAARATLSLSDQRLSLMRGVMASKWISRAPVEDLAQERTVIEGARAAARERGLEEDGVAAVFAQQIAAAKVVQLGWGTEWLLHGFPADEPVPDLATIRAQLAALTPRIIDALTGLRGLHRIPHVRARLLRESERLIRTRFVTDRERAGLVDALLRVRPGREPASSAAASQPGRYCVVVVGKAPKGEMSPVRSKTCSDDRNAPSLKAAAAQTVLLMEWFKNANNRPPSLTRIHGDSGDCDRAGYRIKVVKLRPGPWNNRISGFNAYSWCNVVTGYDLVHTGDRQTWNGTQNPCGCVLVGWVGARMNDRISSFWIRRG